jgi:hypothetical protein
MKLKNEYLIILAEKLSKANVSVSIASSDLANRLISLLKN